MGGFFGVFSQTDCVDDLFYGTDYHSHLGTRRGGVAVLQNDGRFFRRIHDITNAQFRSKFDGEIDQVSGHSGIGVISDTEDQPLLISGKFGSFAIVTVGKINNQQQIVERLFANGYCHIAEHTEGGPNPTELVAMLICRKDNILDGIEHAQKVISGSCSMLVLTRDAIYAARDRYGRTPVVIAKKPGAYAVAMESTSFPNLDYKVEHELGPGEIVEITADKAVIRREAGDTMKICTFFWVYFGYPSSCYEGANTESARYRNGTTLAAADKDMLDEVDSICGIPDSGIAHAIGYSNASGKPYKRSFVKYTPTWPRSFMPQNQQKRNLVAKMKLIPVEEQINGKRMLFCDDSIVRGTQMKDTVVRLYDYGAKAVHMRSACPPILFGCKFLNFSRSKSNMDLAARRAIAKLEKVDDVPDELVEKYLVFNSPEYLAMVEEIRKSMGVTSLRYQELNRLLDAIEVPREKLCTYCWNGKDVEDEAPTLDLKNH